MTDDTLDLPRPIVAIMQPTFLPWQGYFGMIALCDVFVFLDDVQFVRRSFHHRNRLFVDGGSVDWFTLPVADTGQRTRLDQARVSLDAAQLRRLIGRLKHAYGRTPHFDTVYPLIAGRLEAAGGRPLADVNIELITELAKLSGLTSRWCRSAELDAPGQRSAKLAAVLERVGARTYLSASGSFDYMREDGTFPDARMTTVFHRFDPRAYPQRQGAAFVDKLSIVDALFQVGADATGDLIRGGIQRPASWEERAAGASTTEDQVQA